MFHFRGVRVGGVPFSGGVGKSVERNRLHFSWILLSPWRVSTARMFADLLWDIRFQMIYWSLITRCWLLNSILALLMNFYQWFLALIPCLCKIVLFYYAQLSWSRHSRLKCSLSNSDLHQAQRRQQLGRITGMTMSSAVLSALCRLFAALSIPFWDVSDERSGLTFPCDVENLWQSAMYYVQNAWGRCVMDMKEKVVTIWFDSYVMTVCQWNSRVFTSPDFQYRLMTDSGLSLKRKWVSTTRVFWRVKECSAS